MPQHYADQPTTPASVSAVDGVNVSEGMQRALVNNAMRAMVSMVKADFAGDAGTITAGSTFTLASISTGDYIKMAAPAGGSISSFGPASNGLTKLLECLGTTVLRNGASLSVQGGADLTTVAGDLLWLRRSASVWKARVIPASGGTVAVASTTVKGAVELATDAEFIAKTATTVALVPSNLAAMPTFMANKNGTDQTSITSATAIKVTFGTEEWDVGGHFATSTWTPPAGKYRITGQLRWNNTNGVDNEQLSVFLYKNGGVHRRTFRGRNNTSGTPTTVLTALVEANGTDTFEIYANKAGAGDGEINGGVTDTFFCGEAIA